MIDGDELERKCRERARKVRRHAGFFDWHDKEIKELGMPNIEVLKTGQTYVL